MVPAKLTTPAATLAAPAATEAYAKDAIIAWFRGEFAAANAIIDALRDHLMEITGGGSEYEAALAAIHRRRLNWIPILQKQKYYSIENCSFELQRVAEKRREREEMVKEKVPEEEKVLEGSGDESMEANQESINVGDDSPNSEITDTGSQELQTSTESTELCSNHEACEVRCAEMKMTKGFIAKEHVKGHMVNVVRGLKLYEDVFTDTQLSKLSDFASELWIAGRSGELTGETFISYKQQTSGNKRELIQLGAPIFEHVQEEATTEGETNHLEPIPSLLQGVIDHLLQWHLISENRRPNSCIINFFDEGEFSQPFLKPPHIDQPISTLLLSESKMAFGRTLINENDGNYKGPLMLSLKEGSLLVMRGNSSDMARHVMCASPNKRVSITFFRVRENTNQNYSSSMPHLTNTVTLWQSPIIPKPGLIIRAPAVMLAPVVTSPRVMSPGGTGVFLPWTVGSRKPTKHLPPRAQRRRFLSLPSPSDAPASDTGIGVEG